jgi:ABC-type transporter Mla subunit MlaD
MNAIEKLKHARNIRELAHEIEPLAQALASLADDTRQSLRETQQEAARTGENSRQAQQIALAQAETTLHRLNQAADSLSRRCYEARSIRLSITWRVAAIATLTGLLSATATTGLWHWLPQWTAQAQANQRMGALIRQKCQEDRKACDTILKAVQAQ